MKKVVFLVLLIISIIPINVNAQRGCCSQHGGVVGCDESGKSICRDGSLSPSCTCNSGSTNSNQGENNSQSYNQPNYIYGCTNSEAINYNPSANQDDGSCIIKKLGCMDQTAINYDKTANTQDNSCQYNKTIIVTEPIKYKTEYVDNKDIPKGNSTEKIKGVDGKKEITYTAIVDKDGNIISQEQLAENITTEPINQVIERGTSESNNIFIIIWLISLIITFSYSRKHKDASILQNKIATQKLTLRIILYISYVIFIIPVFVDLGLIIIDLIKNKNYVKRV